ncbi:MAG: 3-hydroxyacyl-CoA dehydrogenase NAD-binding domain-containing protein [Gammaproteobacteria bacterium]|nr:3-hydroxyacyl-CoA dehydrogenase NAD-binding domain-containing protein [Gammaproteobacteria bacterium]MCW8910232.1 3-hydroxyacyl-CoA dehydrogenase NAD-binding domain-containing protein [Gammaproteobacteria bacterium]MCW9056648.1 3-hydroxyacyl-CoA dehydrogenase NAD-binding domain-containing protein [Gammaproteobacteria bacterium]
MAYKHWKIERDDENICWLHLDVADSSTNVLSAAVLDELNDVLNEQAQSLPKGIVFVSDKKNGFIAGADINEFTVVKNHDEAMVMLNRGHDIMNKVESMPCTTVAMIKGFCLGGGMELALACNYRVMCDEPSTRIGLPEIKLGIHPGYGGSVRSILKAGPVAAMNAMLTGRMLQGRQAKRMNLVDDLVAERQLKRAARFFVVNKPRPKDLGLKDKIMNHRLVRPFIAKQMRKQVSAKAHKDHYPAPYKLISLWQKHMDNPRRMLKEEAESVAGLVTDYTARNLVRVFFLQEKLKSQGKKSAFNPEHIHVIGGGIMGGDIAAWCALRGFKVTVQDRDPGVLAATMKRSNDMFRKKFKKDKRSIRNALDRLMPDHKGIGVKHADIIIEAIFEDKDVKQTLYKTIEPQMKEGALLATNTSSIPLEQLASCLNDPGRLVGVHFFNPVALMPLVEIVRGDNTSDEVMKKALAFGRQIDKLPLAVKSTPGFLVNRILMPYLLEAVEMVEEGIPAEKIDQAALNFGMPMGPIELADTVGLDVCRSVAKILSETMNVSLPAKMDTMVNNKKLGKKSAEGFYKWVKGKPVKDKNVSYTNTKDLEDRLIFRLLNEAAACLREKVVDDEELIDAGVIFGTGFAPFRGGPMHHIHAEGVDAMKSRLESLASLYGERFNSDQQWASL